MKITNDIRSILNQDNWIKGSYAQDINGNKVSAVDPTACKFCLSGACFRLHLKYAYPARAAFYDAVYKYTRKPISVFNDDPNTTWEDVDQLLKYIETLPEIN